MRGKVSAEQLSRKAVVYVRQSTSTQVLEHGESTARQYALVERAVALGWQREAVEVIDEDLGRSGASTEGRSGFAKLAEAVAFERVGAVLALEVSRLARSSVDWQRLLSLCAVAQVLVVDEQTMYDPNDKDDKLLLDLKGTMSEAELHWLGLRLAGARQNKARRGKLRLPVPTGYVWTERGLELDPDEAVQRAVRQVFERYAIEPSAWAVVRWARQMALAFPTRHGDDPSSEVSWKPLGLSRLHEMLRNPIYAGAYVYGRRPQKTVLVQGQIRKVRDPGRKPERWLVCLQSAHDGYISWERYVSNQEKLKANHGRHGGSRVQRPTRAHVLLGGILVCGRCGRRMRGQYGSARGTVGYYICAGDRDKGQTMCWTLPAAPIDQAVEQLFLGAAVPDELSLSLAVEKQVDEQAEQLAQQWKLRMEQVSYEARRAERRYKAVDPDNRVVARTLEREWEQRLREVEQLERDYDEAKTKACVQLSEQDRARIRRLAKDLKAVWNAPTTGHEDRKAMIALVIEAVSLKPVDVPKRATLVRVQWKTGAVDELLVPRPSRYNRLRPSPETLARVRELVGQGLHDSDVAEQLNREERKTGAGRAWNEWAVRWARLHHGIPRVAPDLPRRLPVPDVLPDGSYSPAGAARRYHVSLNVVRRWISTGLVAAQLRPYDRHPKVWWLQIDDATDAHLRQIAPRTKGYRPTR
jgi:DNA invertase Pin-like site-specific DNA recombinase